eukprot:gene4652-4260_t
MSITAASLSDLRNIASVMQPVNRTVCRTLDSAMEWIPLLVAPAVVTLVTAAVRLIRALVAGRTKHDWSHSGSPRARPVRTSRRVAVAWRYTRCMATPDVASRPFLHAALRVGVPLFTCAARCLRIPIVAGRHVMRRLSIPGTQCTIRARAPGRAATRDVAWRTFRHAVPRAGVFLIACAARRFRVLFATVRHAGHPLCMPGLLPPRHDGTGRSQPARLSGVRALRGPPFFKGDAVRLAEASANQPVGYDWSDEALRPGQTGRVRAVAIHEAHGPDGVIHMPGDVLVRGPGGEDWYNRYDLVGF